MIKQAVKLIKKIGKFLGFGKKEEKAPETEDPEHDLKVEAGLQAIDQEEQQYLKEGKISREDAEKVAASVKSKHPVFKSIEVVDGGETWNYEYKSSNGVHRGPEQAETTYLGAKLVGTSSFEGDFGHPDWNWNGYPQHEVKLHPANSKINYRNDLIVLKPNGNYRIKGKSGGAPSGPLKQWRDFIKIEKEVVVDYFLSEGLNKTKAEIQAKNEIVRKYQNSGYQNINDWDDLDLNGWQGHHIKPVNWGGTDDRDNLQYLRNSRIGSDHQLFTIWWEFRKNEIFEKFKKA